jgi:hypothetical protein
MERSSASVGSGDVAPGGRDAIRQPPALAQYRVTPPSFDISYAAVGSAVDAVVNRRAAMNRLIHRF